ncbi:hypothetical protein F7725_009687 [Dissostichus mawsoni]|uniref:Uncharacterized protein n=1 Tax=Dissostichus mawsoni TaxID=36200 RepID=A0A7J5XMY6_DISMA|nr:hypothetical protein F7725_009687 [Dissostichus mawsoni]
MSYTLMKLGLFIDNLASDPPNLTNFPACGELRNDIPEMAECEMTIHRYRETLEMLQDQFNNRFQDFHDKRGTIQLFTDPISAVVNDQPPELQMELCELQGDFLFQMKRNERGTPGQHTWQWMQALLSPLWIDTRLN